MVNKKCWKSFARKLYTVNTILSFQHNFTLNLLDILAKQTLSVLILNSDLFLILYCLFFYIYTSILLETANKFSWILNLKLQDCLPTIANWPNHYLILVNNQNFKKENNGNKTPLQFYLQTVIRHIVGNVKHIWWSILWKLLVVKSRYLFSRNALS